MHGRRDPYLSLLPDLRCMIRFPFKSIGMETMLRSRALLTSILCLALLSGCAAQPPRVKETASGKPEGVFRNTSIEDARSKIINQCANKGLSVEESSGSQVICSKEMEGTQATFMQMALSNSYSTTPQVKARFVFSKNGADTRVICFPWYESIMPLGQVKTMEAKSNADFNGLMSFLSNAGAE
jgi:hypothetical protein